ncbi:hypothetical protein K7H20_13755 [Salipiger manganoxidans]|uniref:hypothetical protein n=1 Tax=Salipiger marinus TaxID=555512 RepID=UPI001E4CC91B|nr:hypothetical protein [Salipiger manganoxidans]MCD1619130.1 hypothetical protein [Salipiger manganoxidans]
MWTADRAFVGVVAGAEKSFAAGDDITEAEAKELGLKGKPGLATPQTKKDAKDGSATSQA